MDNHLHFRHMLNKINNRYRYAFVINDPDITLEKLKNILMTEEMDMIKFLELKEFIDMLTSKQYLIAYYKEK